MKNHSWHEGMTDKESKNLAYWERNMLALKYADGWYNDDVFFKKDGSLLDGGPQARLEGWRRVLSLDDGKMNFHIPDDFDIGARLPEISPRYDGHSTLEKWKRVADELWIKFDE